VQFSQHLAKPNRRFSLSLIGALGLISSLGLGLLGSSSAMAQAYPNKPIRLVVTFPTGGAPDILARLFSEKSQLGQPIVVDNRPGAGGNIGSDVVAKSAGDGYTLVMGTVGTHSINGALYEKMPYDTHCFRTQFAGGQQRRACENRKRAHCLHEGQSEQTLLCLTRHWHLGSHVRRIVQVNDRHQHDAHTLQRSSVLLA
jgi:hypothetical protein